ncbi:MAG TPA: PTS sugar transporter subunit IIA [Anaerolineales bacterium]|nr:PTS sugar transporter subunit IIA [Anaerolineales bacterium]
MEDVHHSLADLLLEKHIMVGLKSRNAQSAIRQLGRTLVESDHVHPEFIEDVCKRERIFPTGLPTEPFATAIPHADPTHVLRSALSIGILASPVSFSQMGTDGSVQVQVRIIFLLAIKQREKQVGMLQELVGLIQNPFLLTQLVNADRPHSALEILKQT